MSSKKYFCTVCGIKGHNSRTLHVICASCGFNLPQQHSCPPDRTNRPPQKHCAVCGQAGHNAHRRHNICKLCGLLRPTQHSCTSDTTTSDTTTKPQLPLKHFPVCGPAGHTSNRRHIICQFCGLLRPTQHSCTTHTTTNPQPPRTATATAPVPPADFTATAPIPPADFTATAPIPPADFTATAAIPPPLARATDSIPPPEATANAPLPLPRAAAAAPIPPQLAPTPAPTVCAICHRVSTTQHQLQFAPLDPALAANRRIITRQFGDITGMVAQAVVCMLCTIYVCPIIAPTTPLWKHAWPAVIWSCLTKANYAPAHIFLEFLAHDLRASWHYETDTWTHSMRTNVQIPPNFSDCTNTLRTFSSDITSGHLGRLITALNVTCFPQVRCPMGCYMYIDDFNSGKLCLLPAHHYLSTIIPSFTQFNAQPQYFNGARVDWTVPVSELDWIVSPSLIVDADHGLSVVMCSSKQHSDGRRQYIHVPTNPVTNNVAPQTPDYLAPAVVTGEILRQGTSNHYNTSFPVFKQHGNTGGLSTVRLSCRSPPIKMTTELAITSGLILRYRPDILEYAWQSHQFEAETIPHTLQLYERNRPTDHVISKHAQTASFMDYHDAYALGQMFKCSTEDQQKTSINNFLVIIHDNSISGHSPFHVPVGIPTRRRPQRPMGWVAYATIQALLHNRILHHCFLHKLATAPHVRHMKHLADTCNKLTSPNNTLPPTAMIDVTTQLQALTGQHYAEFEIAALLAASCNNVLVDSDNGLWLFPDSYDAVTKVFIVTRAPQAVFPALPLQSADTQWILLLALSIEGHDQYDIKVTFRWSPDFDWQHTGTTSHLQHAQHMPFALYVKQTTLTEARTAVLQRCGGQTRVSCLHHEQYLIREQLGCPIICCSPRCFTSVRWRCPNGIPSSQCQLGLCFKHFKMTTRDPSHTMIACYGPPYHNVCPPPPFPDIHHTVPASDEVTGTPVEFLHANEYEDDLDNNHLHRYAIGANDFPTDGSITTPSTVDHAFLSDDCAFSTSGHYLLNNHLQVLHRKTLTHTPPITTQKVLQQICCRTPHWTVPLLFPESQLFPRIFWTCHGTSVVGALPAVLFSAFGKKQSTLASLKDHMYLRLMDSSLLTSHDHSYLQFLFDVLLNDTLNHNSATIACRKGLEHLNSSHCHQNISSKETILQLDELDARRQVKQLTAILRSEGAWHYFVTFTCNDSGTAGVWPIKAAIQRSSPDELHVHALLQNYSVIMCRAWERSSRYIWNYIQYSPERPLGHVKCAWMRYEFQSSGALGNRPHVHGGITLHEEPEAQSLQRISCCMKDMFTVSKGTDEQTLRNEGIISSHREFSKLWLQASLLQNHSCLNAKHRCQKKRSADDSFICRVQRHPPSIFYMFVEKDKLYDEATLARLQYLDLGTLHPTTGEWQCPMQFRAGKWQYPAQPHEHFVPTVPRLFLATQSCTNVQYCDRKFQVSYLAKYAAGLDEKPNVTMKSDANNTITTETHGLIHEKITGQRFLRQKNDGPVLAREIALTEMIWFSSRLPYVSCERDITHVSTMPPEYRTAVVKARTGRNRIEGGNGDLKPVTARRALPAWRQFTATQVLAIQQFAQGSYYLDPTTGFSVRPPELILFHGLEMYTKWFTFQTSRTDVYTVDMDLQSSSWMDGAMREVKIRHAHVLDVANYIQEQVHNDNVDVSAPALALHTAITLPLRDEYLQQHHTVQFSELYRRFVDISKHRRNIVVYTQVTPKQFSRFLIHLLLTMGRFVTEIDLYSSNSLLQSFRIAGIISPDPPTEATVKHIARWYLLDQMQWLSIGTRQFANLLQALIDGLHRFLLQGTVVYDSIPLVFERDMAQQATDEVLQLEACRRSSAVEALQLENIHNFPDEQLLRAGRPFPYQLLIQQATHQSAESYRQQCSALQQCQRTIDTISEPRTTFAQSPLLVGPPGSGKTHILLAVQVYAMSRGLSTQLVAVTSERARRLGGEHIHLFFSLPVRQDTQHTISALAEMTLFKLMQQPIRLATLRRLSVLFIEEIGLLSAQTFAVLDIVLRHIRDNPVPMGGIVMVACGDPRQLSPVQGTPIWASFHLIATFTVIPLTHYVRAAQDRDLQLVLDILRKPIATTVDIDQFVFIMHNRCIPRNCVKSWNDVPPHVLRIVGTKAASQKITNEFLATKINDDSTTCTHVQAVDQVETVAGQYVPASLHIETKLGFLCREPRTLVLFIGAVMRLTYNNTHSTPTCPTFSQGQLCVIQAIPENISTANEATLSVTLIPPGNRQFTVNNLPPDWTTITLKRRWTPAVTVHSGNSFVKAFRFQFPLTYFVSSTVHKAIGETCAHIATQLSISAKEYRLWEREQLLVLLSRVQTLDAITFVTNDHEDTIEAMVSMLHQRSEWAAHIDNVLTAIQVQHPAPRIVHHIHNPLPPCHRPIPDINMGFVYLIISTQDPRHAYVGETASIRRRLQEHNNGHGALMTNDPYLRPWALLALISRFPFSGEHPDNIQARKTFEAQWHHLNARQHGQCNVHTILHNGRQIFAEASQDNNNLIWEQYGSVTIEEHI